MLPTKFQVNWPFGSGEEVKNRFSSWRPWQPSWISDRKDFSYFWCTSHPNASYQVSSQLAFRLAKKQIFKMAAMAAVLDFRSERFSFFWFTSHLDASYLVSSQLGLVEEAKNRFLRWPPWRPSSISDRHDFSYFWSTSHPNASYQVWSQLAFWLRRRSENRFSRWWPWRPSSISDRNDFSYFWSTSTQCFLPSIENWPRRSRLLKQLLTTHDGRRTLADHNS